MKKVALAVGIAALAVLAAFLLNVDAARGDAVAPATASTSAAPDVDAAVLASAELERARDRTAAAEVAVAAPVATETPAATTAGATRTLSGTIVVVDEHGVEHAAEDGTLSLLVWQQDIGHGHEVAVKAGAWRTELPRDPPVQSLGVAGARLRERAAITEESAGNRFAWPADDWLEVRARWPKSSRLFVRDRISGNELAPVVLAATGGWNASEYEHPGPNVPVEKDLGPSPVELPPSEADYVGMRVVHVRSPGYAWGSIEIHEGRGGERIVLLDRGGDLEIAMTGTISDPGAKLRISHAGSYRPAYEAAIRSTDTHVVRALRAGRLRVAVEIGERWAEPVVLAEAEVDVVPDARARVTLAVSAPKQNALVPLEGVLLLPDAWGLERFTLKFDLREAALDGGDSRFSIEHHAMKPAGDGVRSWSRPGVQPGRYEVELNPIAFRAILDVGDQGLRDARLVVPPPCEVFVRCVDDATGEDVTNEQVSWVGAIPEGLSGYVFSRAGWDAESRRWRFRAPQGEVRVSVHGQAYARASKTIEAQPGTNEVELRLARSTDLRVVLRDGETEVPWDGELVPELEPSEGQTLSGSWSHGDGKITLHVEEPGRYVLKIPEIPGFEPVPDAEVRLEKGVAAEHVVTLVRKR